jgi:two-component system, OmpR family, response regulator
MGKKSLSKMLFVDDDEDVLTIAKYCLKNLTGISVKYLRSGEEAIREALDFQPDLILLDVMMPKMDGIATIKAMKLMPKIAHIPVIFFTAKAQKEEISNYLKLGVIDVITKPFDPITLGSDILNIWDKYQEKNV